MDYSIIKNLLEERNMSFKELSDTLGVDRNNLYNSLTKGNPTLQRLEAIAEVLDVPVWRLFTDENRVEIYGTIVYQGEVYSINSVKDFTALAEKISK
ncbi:MAG: helix-turn-helix domain-containing protein [Alistipes sp.]|nr:helix-turn-helix domain-containing protein [Alistipes sp.]